MSEIPIDIDNDGNGIWLDRKTGEKYNSGEPLTDSEIILAYNHLPVSVPIQSFCKGHGNWGLTEKEYSLAKRLAKALKE